MNSAVLNSEALPLAPAKQPVTEEQSAVKAATGRFTSLDAFRGFTVILMLLVNNVALDTQTPAQLMHAGWNAGLTLADLVFPWFLLCVGLAIPFSAASAKRKSVPSWKYELRILVRSALLIGIGCLLESATLKKPVFSMGVLQLIGFAYLIGAWGYELPKKRRAIAAVALLLMYGLALKYFPVPGTAPGTFTETTNWAAYMNNTFFAPFNLEGILSAIPTGALVLVGTIFGDYLLAPERSPIQRTTALSLGGVALVFSGIVWNLSLPYNKPYWTPSYILVAGGIGLLILTLFYLVTDANGARKWALPLVIFGANAMVAYALPIFVKLTMLSVWTVKTPTGPEPVLDHLLHILKASMGNAGGGWTYTIGYIVIWGALLWVMYRKKIFVRV